jgi:23S rRNA maturation-related 3'-5' exoribonuclease YhaM
MKKLKVDIELQDLVAGIVLMHTDCYIVRNGSERIIYNPNANVKHYQEELLTASIQLEKQKLNYDTIYEYVVAHVRSCKESYIDKIASNILYLNG